LSQEAVGYAQPPLAGEPRQNVGGSARRGFLWLMTQTLFGKIVNSLSTFVAAWFLLPDDYKLVALAFPITQFISVMQQLGVDKVLVARSGDFERWCNPGFWMSSAAGLASGLLIVAAAPVAAHVFKQPALLPMLLLLAIAAPLNGITTVHQAWLQVHFRFRLIAWLGIGGMAIQAGLTILMAWRHYGPYALIVPIMAQSIFRFAAYWAAVRLPLRFKLEIHEWRHIIQDSVGAFGTQFNQLVVAQGDFLLLGLLLPPEATLLGYFSFAFNLSAVVMASLVVNLATVLFPALSTMADDPRRQTEVFLRACRRIGIIGAPLCLLQAAVAAPLLHIIYGDKWNEAIVPLQILSVCMGIRVVGATQFALFSAQRRFRFQFALSTITAIIFLGAVALGAMFRTATAVAWAESIYYLVFENLSLYLAIRHGGGTVRDILRLYSVPVLAGGIAVGTALMLGRAVSGNEWIQMIVTGITTTVIYLPLIRVFDRPSLDEITALWSRFLPGRAATKEINA
jgi:O-antigen/teichoic acid export membrane protein